MLPEYDRMGGPILTSCANHLPPPPGGCHETISHCHVSLMTDGASALTSRKELQTKTSKVQSKIGSSATYISHNLHCSHVAPFVSVSLLVSEDQGAPLALAVLPCTVMEVKHCLNLKVIHCIFTFVCLKVAAPSLCSDA